MRLHGAVCVLVMFFWAPFTFAKTQEVLTASGDWNGRMCGGTFSLSTHLNFDWTPVEKEKEPGIRNGAEALLAVITVPQTGNKWGERTDRELVKCDNKCDSVQREHRVGRWTQKSSPCWSMISSGINKVPDVVVLWATLRGCAVIHSLRYKNISCAARVVRQSGNSENRV